MACMLWVSERACDQPCGSFAASDAAVAAGSGHVLCISVFILSSSNGNEVAVMQRHLHVNPQTQMPAVLEAVSTSAACMDQAPTSIPCEL